MEHPVLQVLFKTDPRKPYAADLLRPFHGTCWAGWAAALGTVKKCLWINRGRGLTSNEEGRPSYNVPCAHLLRVLAAADQAQAVAFHSEQLEGLLTALTEQQQQQQQQEEEEVVVAVEERVQQSLAQVSLDDTQDEPLSGIVDNHHGRHTSSSMFQPSSSSSSSCVDSLSSNSTATSGVVGSSSSGGGGSSRATAAPHLLPTAASAAPPKPCGAWLTTVGVEGFISATTMQQLVSLLDMLPRAQRLQHVELHNCRPGRVRSLDLHERDSLGRWLRYKEVLAALEEEGTASTTVITNSSSSSSSSGGGGGGGGYVGTSNSTCLNERISKSSTTACSAVGTFGLRSSSWRSSCRTLYLDGGNRTMGVADLAPLLECVQQLHALDLGMVKGAALPLSAANSFKQLRLLRFSSVIQMGDGSLWAAVAAATKLQRLKITNSNDMQHMPPAIAALTGVTHLDLSGGNLTSSGLAGVGGMTALRKLKLSNCPITTLPSSVDQLINLHTLDLRDTRVRRLPGSISTLPGLRSLKWVCSYPNPHLEEVWGLRGLHQLSIFLGDAATSVPAAIRQLTALTQLSVYGGALEHLEDLPATLGPLHQLRRLELSAITLGPVPDSITALTQLQERRFYAVGGPWSPTQVASAAASPFSEISGMNVLMAFAGPT
jgi:hypothetical protein